MNSSNKDYLSTSVTGYKRRTHKKGDQILKDGDFGEEMFVIAKGKVQVSKVIDGNRVNLGELERGEFFGEMSLLEGLPRSADVYASSDTELLVISSGGLLLKIRRDPTFALEMLRVLSGRLRKTTNFLEDSIKDSHESSSAETRL